MKRIIFTFLITAYGLFAQQENRPDLSMFLSLKDRNSSSVTISSNTDSRLGFITGYIESFNDSSSSAASNLHFGFFNQLPESYWYQKKYPFEELSDTKRAELYKHNLPATFNNLLIHFEMYPGNYKKGDKVIDCYFKYMVYKKIKKINDFKYNYDISFHEKFKTIPVNEEYILDLFKEFLPRQEIKVKFLIGKPELPPIIDIAKTEETIEANDLIGTAEEVVKIAGESKINFTDLKIGLEYVRTNKKGNEVLLRKLEYPLIRGKNLAVNNKLFPLNTYIYKGKITTAYVIYNKEKENLFKKSKYANYSNNFIIYAIPLSKKGDKYSFKLIIVYWLINGGSRSYQEIELVPDQKYKLSLINVRNSGSSEEIIDGERFIIDPVEDYNKYVDEYLIISLEK